MPEAIQIQLKKGVLELCVLALLSRGDGYAYDIASRLAEGIGMGFIAMKFGSIAAQPGWLTMLPGMLLAGIGIGITNTPVTNTTTASVSPSRAGMASGIDMSARLITLAVNIALMGIILVEGIAAALRHAAPTGVDPTQLRTAAEAVAAGQAAIGNLPEAVVQQGLTAGFGLVMIYGGAAALILAVLSFVLFRPGREAPRLRPEDETGSGYAL